MIWPRKNQGRRPSDRELEQALHIRKNDPTAEAFGGRVYTTDDIKRLEEERVPWLKRKRRRIAS